MLKAFVRTHGGARAFVMFALSALLACFALPHHAHMASAAPSGGEAASAVVGSQHGTAAPSAPEADPDSSPSGGDCEQEHPEPACHNTEAQVMDLSKRWSAAGSDDLSGLLGAVVVVLAGGALLLARARSQRCWTRPPLRLAGFSLLINLGVSRT